MNTSHVTTILDARCIFEHPRASVSAKARRARNRETIISHADDGEELKREVEALREKKRELLRKQKLALMARFEVLSPAAKDHIRYLPAGFTLIRQFGELSGVDVVKQTAYEMEAQRRLLLAKGHLPFFGFSHDDGIGPAAFWCHEFYWREGALGGVYCRGSFSLLGRAFCAKQTRYFSPECQRSPKWPHPIIARVHDKGTMGAVIGHHGCFGAKLSIPALDL